MQNTEAMQNLEIQPTSLQVVSDKRCCLECGNELRGRSDKKFCDDQCRSNHNNKEYCYLTTDMRVINKILRKNRRILDSVVKNHSKGRVSKTNLYDRGFNFKYFTHMFTTQKGTEYKLCYDYGYFPIVNDYYMVVKWGGEN